MPEREAGCSRAGGASAPSSILPGASRGGRWAPWALRAPAEGLISRVKGRLAYERLTRRGLGNAGIHVGLVLMVVYAVCIAAYGIGGPELRQSVAFFA